MELRSSNGRTKARFWTGLILIAVAGAFAAPASAEGPTVEGAGSTWSELAISQWRADVARRGLNINYQGNGSTAGRSFYVIDQTDFAVSEIPFEPQELNELAGKNKSFQYLPIVAGGTSFMYNLVDDAGKRITDLRLSSRTLAGIFTGTVRKWTDPAITEDNAGRVLPERDIIPVIRSDSSGTSNQFSRYLWKTQPAIWADFARTTGIRNEPTSDWPQFAGSVGQPKSDGVANYVSSDSIGKGSINYVEYGYAKARGRPVAEVRNQAGNFSLPTAGNVAVALSHASFNPDFTQNLDEVYRASEPSAYPVSSYSYMITPTAEKDLSAAKGAVLGKFILYFACEGQQVADRLGYSPMPANLVQGAFDAVKRIPGAPEPPPMSECDNPTIKGGLPPPSGFTSPTSAPDPIVSKAATAAEAVKTSKAAAAQAATKSAQAKATGAATAQASGGPSQLGVGPVVGAEASPEAIAAAEAEAAVVAAVEAAEEAGDPEAILALSAALKDMDLPIRAFVVAAVAIGLLVFSPHLWGMGAEMANSIVGKIRQKEHLQ